jgi:Ca2+/Na+ antiporter
MTQQRLAIPVLGGIFFLIIIIGGALNGDPSLLVAIIDALLFCLFVYFLRKKRLRAQEVNLKNDKQLFSISDRILIFFVLYLLVALPFFLGIFLWPWLRH